MKKRLIALIILTLSLGIVGCASDKDETTSNSKEVVTQEESKEEKKRSSDEMYELYASKLDEVEKLFKENNIDFKVKNDKKNTKYDEKVSIAYENGDNNNIGEFSLAGYGLTFEKNGDIMYVSADMKVNVSDDEMKAKEFKFEDTEFYKLKNILIPELDNLDEINEKVNKAYKNLTSLESVKIESENIEERILIGDNSIVYTVIINP